MHHDGVVLRAICHRVVLLDLFEGFGFIVEGWGLWVMGVGCRV